LNTRVSIELQSAQLISTHSITVTKKVIGDVMQDSKKKSVDDMRIAAELSVEQHWAKTQITAETKKIGNSVTWTKSDRVRHLRQA